MKKKDCLFTLQVLVVLVFWGCGNSGSQNPPPTPSPLPSSTSSTPVPLTDMGANRYLQFSGGLYWDGNEMPSTHSQRGMTQAQSIKPLNTLGQSSPSGKYVLLSIGPSHATQEFCSRDGSLPCDPWAFIGQALADPSVNKTTLALINGAQGQQDAVNWDSPSEADYDMVRDDRLAPQGLSEAQVQIVWLKEADARPTLTLPDLNADAFALERNLGNILRSLKVRYPNLKQVFLSSRSYAGYANTDLNPEPYAYESGFSVKWIIQAQIDQMANGGTVIDSRSGDLNYNSVAPWLAWGPYLWANGTNPRSDGLVWNPEDFQGDGTHPSQSGEQKVATMLLNFFKTSPHTKCWFVTGGTCP